MSFSRPEITPSSELHRILYTFFTSNYLNLLLSLNIYKFVPTLNQEEKVLVLFCVHCPYLRALDAKSFSESLHS